jgi:16S rRNA (adenine1518-N6/adenine1519-N6)-dimethyltransferase
VNEIGSIKKVRELLADKQLRIKKHFGQNFLTDQNMLRKIADAGKLTKASAVIEIGPGLGGLTEGLLAQAGKVLAYEIDTDLIPILNDQFHNQPHFQLLHQDILEANIDADIEKHLQGYTDIAVIANLPYYITTPILMRILETSKKVSRLIVMMQLEVASRLAAKPNTKEYNALSIVIQCRANVKTLFKVSRTVFIPAPNVDSAVVSLEITPFSALPEKEHKAFYHFVHACFTQRRKTLLNNLLTGPFGKTRSAYETVLTNLGIALDARAEQLEIRRFVDLYVALQDQ